MKISKLIQHLDTMRRQYGDIEVVTSYTGVSALYLRRRNRNSFLWLDENTKDNMILLIE
jgi:hypothetical protein